MGETTLNLKACTVLTDWLIDGKTLFQWTALSISKEYIQDLVEYSGLRHRSVVDLRRELHSMKFKQRNEWVSGLRRLIDDFYSSHLESMTTRFRESIGPKAYCYDHPPWPDTLDTFLRKSALYHEIIVIPDILFEIVPPEGQLGDYSPRYPFDRFLTDTLSLTLELEPWIEDGFLEIVALPRHWSETHDLVDSISDEDASDAQWASAALIDEDDRTSGEAVIGKWIQTVRTMWSESHIQRRGGERAFAESVAFRNPSRCCAEAILAASPMGLAPVTESKQAHRLLGLWIQRRCQKLGDRAKESQAIVDLGLDEIGFMQSLPPRKILEIRNSEDFSFKNFRREWAIICSNIESMPWEPAFPAEVRTLWNERVDIGLRAIKQDISYLRKKLGAGAGLTTLSLVASLVHPSIPYVARAILASMPVVLGGHSVLDYLEKMKEIKRNSMYFLYRLSA